MLAELRQEIMQEAVNESGVDAYALEEQIRDEAAEV